MNPGPDTSYVSESPWSNSQSKGSTFTPWSSNVSLILYVFTLCQPQWRLVHVGLHLIFSQELFPHIFHYFITSVTLSVNVFTPTPKTLCLVPCRLQSFQRMGSPKSNEICLLKFHIYKVICDTGAYVLFLFIFLHSTLIFPCLYRVPKCPRSSNQLPGVHFNEDLFLAWEEFLGSPQTRISFFFNVSVTD